MADEYEYKDPNTDIMKALSKAVDAATGKTGTQYEYNNPNTDVIQKIEELTEAIATSGGGGGLYIDTDTVIQSETSIPANTDITYTATQNCVVVYYINIAANSMGGVSVNGVSVDGGWRTTLTGLRGFVFIKKGQKITLRQTYTTENGFYTVYGVSGS